MTSSDSISNSTIEGTYIFSSLTNLIGLETSCSLMFSKIDHVVPGILHWPVEKIMMDIAHKMKTPLNLLKQELRPFHPFFVHFVVNEKEQSILVFCSEGSKCNDVTCPDYSFCYR